MNKFYFLLLGFFLSFLFFACETNNNVSSDENTFAGVLVDEQDTPIPYAIITAVKVSEGKTNLLVNEQVVFVDTTDEDGNFELKNLPSPLGSIKLKVEHPDFKPFEDFILTFLEKQDRKKLRLRILHNDDCCGMITVKTLGPDSAAIGNVEVRLNRGKDIIRKGKTNDDGVIAFERVCAGNYWVRIAKEGYQVIEREFGLENCDTLNLVYVLQRKEVDTCCNGVLKVEVKNKSNGEVLNGALVKLRKNGMLLTTLTVKENQPVYFRELCPGTYSLLVMKEGFKAIERDVTFECNDTISITEELEQDTCCNSVVRINVRNSENQPIVQAKVIIWKNGTKLGYYYTNNDGYVVFRELCKGTYAFDVQREGYKSIEFSVEVNCNEEKEITKTLEANEQDTCCRSIVVVHVKDKSSNENLNGAKVKMWREGVVYKTETVTEGAAIFRNVCQGKYGLSIIKDTYKTIEFTLEVGCDDTLEMTKYLERESSDDTCCNGRLVVYVKDSTQNTALGNATVILWKGSTKVGYLTTNGDGRVVFEKLCAGEYQISIAREGYHGREFSFNLECNQTLEFVKKLLRKTQDNDTCCNGKVVLYVKDSTENTAIYGATVVLWKGSTKVGYLTTNQDGKIVFEKLCPGEYSISIGKTGYYGKEFAFGLECNETKEFTKRILRKSGDTCCTAVLKLKIVDDATGNAISGARVRITYGGTVVGDPVSNSEGWAAEDGLCAPRTYGIRVSAEGYQTREFEITFSECNTIKETVRLIRQ